jgi:hypothetical protein
MGENDMVLKVVNTNVGLNICPFYLRLLGTYRLQEG